MSKLIPLTSCFDVYEARILQTYLNAHGIYAVVPEWHHATQAWHHTVALQGVRVCVIEEEYTDAVTLLESQTQPDETVATSHPVPESRQRRSFKLIAIFLWWWSGIATPFWRRRRHWSGD